MLKSSKENVNLLEGQLADMKKEVEKKNKSLAERDELLAVEKKKEAFNAAQLKELEKEVAQHKGQLLELQSALDLKEENRVGELTKASYDAYREVKFLNPGVELNLRGLDTFHGVKDGKF
jgi:chromosome segregation ATPase